LTSRNVSGSVGKEFNLKLTILSTIQRAGDCSTRDGGDQREVLQAVWAIVGVVSIIGGHAIATEVDTEARITVDAIAENPVVGGRVTGCRYTSPRVSGNDVIVDTIFVGAVCRPGYSRSRLLPLRSAQLYSTEFDQKLRMSRFGESPGVHFLI
jgi:hypothetical protein